MFFKVVQVCFSFPRCVSTKVLHFLKLFVTPFHDGKRTVGTVLSPVLLKKYIIRFWRATWKRLENVSSFTKSNLLQGFLSFYMLKFGLTRNEDSVNLRQKIDKRNKRPLLALENLIRAPGANSSIYCISRPSWTSGNDLYPIDLTLFCLIIHGDNFQRMTDKLLEWLKQTTTT